MTKSEALCKFEELKDSSLERQKLIIDLIFELREDIRILRSRLHLLKPREIT